MYCSIYSTIVLLCCVDNLCDNYMQYNLYCLYLSYRNKLTELNSRHYPALPCACKKNIIMLLCCIAYYKTKGFHINSRPI